jgi:hypothetical protein
MRRPVQSAHLLLHDRSWVLGFAMESAGFLLYAAGLALASLALVQSILAGGIGVLAYGSARITGRRLSGRERTGVLVSVLGLVALAVSLIGGSGKGDAGSTGAILLWLGLTAGVALLLLVAATIVFREPVPDGALGVLRVLAFVAVTAGAVLLARPDAPTAGPGATASL